MSLTSPCIAWRAGWLSSSSCGLDKAAADLESVALDPKLDQQRRDVATLYLAKCFDSMGRCREALDLYSRLSADLTVYSRIRAAAERYLVRPFPARQFEKLRADLRLVDTLNYD